MKHTAPSVQQFIYPRQFSSNSHPIQKSCCHKEPQAVETFDSSAGEAASRSNSFLPSNHGCTIWEYGGYAVTKIRFQPFSITRNHFPSNFLIHYTKRAEPALPSSAVCKARKVLLTRMNSSQLSMRQKRAEPAPTSATVCKAQQVLLTRAILRNFPRVKKSYPPLAERIARSFKLSAYLRRMYAGMPSMKERGVLRSSFCS